MSDSVLSQHIKTFVNEFSVDLGVKGHQAVEKLEQMARHAGAI